MMIATLIVWSSFQANVSQAKEGVLIFADAPAGFSASLQREATLKAELAYKSHRYVTANFAPLRAKASGFRLNVSSAFAWPVTLERSVATRGITGLALSGKVTEKLFSDVQLVLLSDNTLTGYVTVGVQTFTFHTIDAKMGVYAIIERDQSAYWAADANRAPVPVDASTYPQIPSRPVGPLDTADRIDVLVLWTDAAEVAAGGSAQMLAEANTAVASSNTAYQQSGIPLTMRMVHAQKIDYTQSGDHGTDLDRLRNKTDGFMDDAHTLRDIHKADFVTLFVEKSGQGCGVAYYMSTLSQFFERNAVSVTERSCISNLTFQHEIGHNMGTAHDPLNAGGGQTLYPYSYGYQDPAREFRTVLAYNCPNGGCPRINWFSSATNQQNGKPLGNANQDNTRSITNVLSTIANFRQGDAPVVPTATPTVPPTSTPTPLPPRSDTVGVYDSESGTFSLRNSNSAGQPDITARLDNLQGPDVKLPVVGDWNADGVDTIGVFDTTTGVFSLSDTNANNAPVNYTFTLGNPDDTPFAGRWTDDMPASGVGVYRNTNGILYQKKQLTTGFSDFFAVFGNPGDVGVAGDWDGNGFDSVGIYRASNTSWFLSNNSTPSGVTFSDIDFVWTTGGGRPLVGDWDADKTTTVGYYSVGGNFVLHSTNAAAGADNTFAFGGGGTKTYPIAGKWTAGAGANPQANLLVQPGFSADNSGKAD
jgi:hypothetical protein